MSIPNPKIILIKELNNMFYKFIWEDKPDKINRKQLTRGYIQGGLKMLDLTCFIKGLKISWVRRLYKNTCAPWIHLVPLFVGSVNKVLFFGSSWSFLIAQKMNNQFWKDVILAWHDLIKNISENNGNYSTNLGPLWYNPFISDTTTIIPQLYSKGVISPIDLISANGELMTKESIALNFNIHIDFLSCYRMISSFKKYMSNHAATLENIQRPYYHNHIKLLCKSTKGSKDFYDLLKTDKSTSDLRCLYKWETDLNISLDLNSWKNIHKICFFSIKDNSLIWFQYKVTYRLIGVKHYLHKIKLSTSPTCGLCHENEETIYHLFVSCKESFRFWGDIKVRIKQVLKVEIVLSPSTVIFGNWELETPNYLVNILSITAKYYIFQCSRKHIKYFRFSKICKQYV